MSLKKDEICDQFRDGKYILAVSAGVDSVVLLDILSGSSAELVVAHVDHGIRTESHWEDRFSKQLAQNYGLEYESTKAELGAEASEALARKTRYAFLNKIMEKHQAKGVITAHHKDDLLETMVLNLIRGTNWRGLVSLSSGHKLLRPLLSTSKADIYEYALHNRLEWLEDETNADTKYLRNLVRKTVMPSVSPEKLNSIFESLKKNKYEIDELVVELEKYIFDTDLVDRNKFIHLPVVVRRELIASVYRDIISDMSSKEVKQIEQFICTAKQGKKYLPRKNIEMRALSRVVEVKIS